ncbi:MAG: cation:proton antiporter regulatory subunit [Halobacteriales archaeon]
MTAVDVAPTTAVATVMSLTVVSAVFAVVVAFLHRLYSRQPSPVALNALAGLGAVAFWLNTAGALASYTTTGASLVSPDAVVVNLVSLGTSAGASVYAGRLGDRVGIRLTNLPEYDGDVGRLVRSAGRNVTVRVPEADEIRDIDGYDPVADETKAEVAGKEYVFPRGLTVEELRSRLVNRLKQSGDIGYVDIELDEHGNVEHIGLGRNVSGLGPTLAPGTCAVAVRADPAYASSPGDTVRLYVGREDGVERVADGELRGAVEDVVTVALDRRDARSLDPDTTYRLATLPSEKLPEREFAAMLRSADETVAVVEVGEGSGLVGKRLDSLGVSVVAVETEGEVVAVPDKTRTIEPGDVLYAVGRPDELRRLDGGV